MKVVNDIVEKYGFPVAAVYTDLGLKQVEMINSSVGSWLAKQAFRDTSESYAILGLDVESVSMAAGKCGKDETDLLVFKVNFQEKPHENKGILAKDLSHTRNRFPDLRELNSEPRIMHTGGYISICLQNGDGGWIRNGEFPKNVHMVTYEEAVKRMERREIPAYTDIRREALAGFRAAKAWAKFRVMALSSTDVLENRLDQIWEGLKDVESGNVSYDISQKYRSLKEFSIPLFLGLLPDIMTSSGPSALKSFYLPGALEAAASFAIEKGHSSQHETMDDPHVRPIYTVGGSPIEIVSKPGRGAYDARINLLVNIFGDVGEQDDVVRPLVEKSLLPYFDVEAVSSDKFKVGFDVSDAHKVAAEIREGSDKTGLHKEIANFVSALVYVRDRLDTWNNEVMPALKVGYDASVLAAQNQQFGDRLPYSLNFNGYSKRTQDDS